MHCAASACRRSARGSPRGATRCRSPRVDRSRRSRNLMRRTLCCFVVSLLSLGALPARAWGDLGHRLVGELAQPLLTPKAAAGVAELLAGEPDPTLAGIAN